MAISKQQSRRGHLQSREPSPPVPCPGKLSHQHNCTTGRPHVYSTHRRAARRRAPHGHQQARLARRARSAYVSRRLLGVHRDEHPVEEKLDRAGVGDALLL
jgi:hypothetical protein